MSKLYIILVCYNESINLNKCFAGIGHLQSKMHIQVLYIDQSSTDDSVEIATKNNAKIYIHPNLGYADPDKRWAVENLVPTGDDWVLILDADEEVSEDLADEIQCLIQGDQYDIGDINIESQIFRGYGGRAYQKRLFRKKAVQFTDNIHEYIVPNSPHIKCLKSILINNDLKYIGKEIRVFVEKLNRYSDIEMQKYLGMGKGTIVFHCLFRPVQWFFGFYIIHKQFLRGFPGLLLCMLMAYYQFMIYAKLYEKKFIHK